MSAEAAVNLSVQKSTYDVPGRAQAFRLDVTVTSAENIESAIFLYSRIATASDTKNVYECVCDPLALTRYPENAPEEATGMFRRATGSWICATAEERDTLWAQLKSDIAELTRSQTAVNEPGESSEEVSIVNGVVS